MERTKKMVLENKLGISNEIELAKQEERITKKKALELFETKRTRKNRSRNL